MPSQHSLSLPPLQHGHNTLCVYPSVSNGDHDMCAVASIPQISTLAILEPGIDDVIWFTLLHKLARARAISMGRVGDTAEQHHDKTVIFVQRPRSGWRQACCTCGKWYGSQNLDGPSSYLLGRGDRGPSLAQSRLPLRWLQ